MTAPRPSFIRLATGMTAAPSTTWTLTGIRRMVSKFAPGSAAAVSRAVAPGRPPGRSAAPRPLMSAGANVLVPPVVVLSLWLMSELCPCLAVAARPVPGLPVIVCVFSTGDLGRRFFARRPAPAAPYRLELLDQRTSFGKARLEPLGNLQTVTTDLLQRPLETVEHPVRIRDRAKKRSLIVSQAPDLAIHLQHRHARHQQRDEQDALNEVECHR